MPNPAPFLIVVNYSLALIIKYYQSDYSVTQLCPIPLAVTLSLRSFVQIQ